MTFTLDLRDSRESERQTAEEEIRKTAKDLEVKQGVTIVFEQLHNLDPILCDEKIVTIAEESAKETGVEYLKMISGAAHDTINIAEFAPVGMLFIPSLMVSAIVPMSGAKKRIVEMEQKCFIKPLRFSMGNCN